MAPKKDMQDMMDNMPAFLKKKGKKKTAKKAAKKAKK